MKEWEFESSAFGQGRYRRDEELEFRKPLQSYHRYPATQRKIFKRLIFTLGIILILSLILILSSFIYFFLFDNQGLEVGGISSQELPSPTPYIPPISPIISQPHLPHLVDIQISYETPSLNYDGTLWGIDFTPATTELSPILFDVNNDGIPDLLTNQITDRLEQTEYCSEKCIEDFGHTPCQVQLVALDGGDGSVVWKTWLEFAPFAINCRHDLTGDQHPDCILSGRSGSLVALDMKQDGSLIWVVDEAPTFPMYNFYYPLLEWDFDKDGITDLVVTHGGDVTYAPTLKDRTPGTLFVVSGRTGEQLSDRIPMPDDKETYSSPVLFNMTDNIQLVLFGSGGETISGSLWAVTLQSLQELVDRWLAKKSSNVYKPNKTYTNPKCVSASTISPKRPKNSPNTFKHGKNEEWMSKCPLWSKDTRPMWNPYQLCVYELVPGGKTGTMLPPVIIDHNGDGIKDLLVSQFNDHIIMIDGASGNTQWDHKAEDTQSYSVPAPIHFNEDSTPDFLIRFDKGKLMHYDFSYMGVLDGTSGELLWTLKCLSGAIASAVTVKSSKVGHDGMLFFAGGCKKTRERKSGTRNSGRPMYRHIVAEESTTCEEERVRNKRHAEGGNEGEMSMEQLQHLWEVGSEEDSFPDPWTETRAFIEEYCELSYDKLTTDVYYLTPKMITFDEVKPIYRYEPYVNKLPYESSEQQESHWSISGEERKALRCSQVIAPYMISATPIIGDFNKDGKLDGAVSIMYYTQDSSMNIFHSQKVNFRVFTIQDRLVEVYGPEILDIVDFKSYYSADKQPWSQYMGPSGDGVYFSPAQ